MTPVLAKQKLKRVAGVGILRRPAEAGLPRTPRFVSSATAKLSFRRPTSQCNSHHSIIPDAETFAFGEAIGKTKRSVHCEAMGLVLRCRSAAPLERSDSGSPKVKVVACCGGRNCTYCFKLMGLTCNCYTSPHKHYKTRQSIVKTAIWCDY